MPKLTRVSNAEFKMINENVYWAILSELDEAGGEDICSLLNTKIAGQSESGMEEGLSEYLDAVSALEYQGKVQLAEDRAEVGCVPQRQVISGDYSKLHATFEFDPSQYCWTWNGPTRIFVELPDA